jgi:hypothetical protein
MRGRADWCRAFASDWAAVDTLGSSSGRRVPAEMRGIARKCTSNPNEIVLRTPVNLDRAVRVVRTAPSGIRDIRLLVDGLDSRGCVVHGLPRVFREVDMRHRDEAMRIRDEAEKSVVIALTWLGQKHAKHVGHHERVRDVGERLIADGVCFR